MSGIDAPIKPGSALALKNIPIGSLVHCIEMKPGKGAQMARSAGASVQVVAREGEYVTVRLRSGEMRKVHVNCRATIGEVGNDKHNLRKIGKAGRSAGAVSARPYAVSRRTPSTIRTAAAKASRARVIRTRYRRGARKPRATRPAATSGRAR